MKTIKKLATTIGTYALSEREASRFFSLIKRDHETYPTENKNTPENTTHSIPSTGLLGDIICARKLELKRKESLRIDLARPDVGII
ncbi:MAG: hypothetical protein JSU72_20070 [Deltaproteobacteria bacterium]|nr:MAG: hypothetical protein JSU72_20070 [Deltaproteobacteria bacterium]